MLDDLPRSIACLIAAIRLVTPVDVSLCTTSTALIACALSLAESRLDDGRVDAAAPVAGNEVDDQPQPVGDLAPERREVAGFEHQYLDRPGESVLTSAASHAPVPDAG